MVKKQKRTADEMRVDVIKCILRKDKDTFKLSHDQEELVDWAQNCFYIPLRLRSGLVLSIDRAITARKKEDKKTTEMEELKEIFF